MGYRQLTQAQRYQIFAYLETGISQRQIAKAIGVHSSAISREIKRNGLTAGYAPEQAQLRSDQRRCSAWKVTKRLPSLIQWVTDQLRDEWSPQQISGFMANANGACVSHQWIYALIWDDKKHGGELWKRLRLPRQRRYQRRLAKHAGLGKIPHRVGIALRRVVAKLNNRPRKRLGYRTPAQVFLGEYSGALKTAGAALNV